eukprot:gene21466-22337_t
MNLSIESMALDVTDQEMLLFQQFFRDQIGLYLPDSKKALLCSRLSRRLSELGISKLQEYYALLCLPQQESERQRAIDLVTTNETYFFREPKHFEYLRDELLPQLSSTANLHIWSAASSTGEEAYSIAMLLEDCRAHRPWRIFASDISMRVLSFARRALYPMARGEQIPHAYLSRYCLCGTGEYEGHFLVDQRLRRRVEFARCNLLDLPPDLHQGFDIVFLRNTIIYFDFPTKVAVLKSVIEKIKPGGWLFVGHSESLHGMPLDLQMIAPSIYRRLP